VKLCVHDPQTNRTTPLEKYAAQGGGAAPPAPAVLAVAKTLAGAKPLPPPPTSPPSGPYLAYVADDGTPLPLQDALENASPEQTGLTASARDEAIKRVAEYNAQLARGAPAGTPSSQPADTVGGGPCLTVAGEDGYYSPGRRTVALFSAATDAPSATFSVPVEAELIWPTCAVERQCYVLGNELLELDELNVRLAATPSGEVRIGVEYRTPAVCADSFGVVRLTVNAKTADAQSCATGVSLQRPLVDLRGSVNCADRRRQSPPCYAEFTLCNESRSAATFALADLSVTCRSGTLIPVGYSVNSQAVSQGRDMTLVESLNEVLARTIVAAHGSVTVGVALDCALAEEELRLMIHAMMSSGGQSVDLGPAHVDATLRPGGTTASSAAVRQLEQLAKSGFPPHAAESGIKTLEKQIDALLSASPLRVDEAQMAYALGYAEAGDDCFASILEGERVAAESAFDFPVDV
jgi:hypothetical protein